MKWANFRFYLSYDDTVNAIRVVYPDWPIGTTQPEDDHASIISIGSLSDKDPDENATAESPAHCAEVIAHSTGISISGPSSRTSNVSSESTGTTSTGTMIMTPSSGCTDQSVDPHGPFAYPPAALLIFNHLGKEYYVVTVGLVPGIYNDWYARSPQTNLPPAVDTNIPAQGDCWPVG